MRGMLMSLWLTAMCAAQPGQKLDWSSRVASDPALTGSERMRILVRNNFASPAALFRSVIPAIAAEITNRPREWHRTAGGFGRRVGFNFAMFTAQDVIQATSSAMLGRDPRYQRCDCKNVWGRTRQAFSGLVLSADSHGVRRFDPSNLMSSYASGYIGASLYPDRYSVAVKGTQLGHLQVSQVVIENLLIEFGPDIKRFLKRKILRRP